MLYQRFSTEKAADILNFLTGCASTGSLVSIRSMLCSNCHTAERIRGQRWCRECLTSYQRQRRQRLASPLYIDGSSKTVPGRVIDKSKCVAVPRDGSAP